MACSRTGTLNVVQKNECKISTTTTPRKLKKQYSLSSRTYASLYTNLSLLNYTCPANGATSDFYSFSSVTVSRSDQQHPWVLYLDLIDTHE